MNFDKKQESVKNIISETGVSDIAALIYIDMLMHSDQGKFLASVRTLSRRHNKPIDVITESMTALQYQNLIQYRLSIGRRKGDNEYYVIFNE